MPDLFGYESIRGLTLWQPYASLIAIGAKTIETRSWGTSYRGWLAIHAAKKCDQDMRDDCERCMAILKEAGFTATTPAGERLGQFPWSWTLGKILCVVRLVSCQPAPHVPRGFNGTFGTFGPGRFGWTLTDLRVLPEPIPYRGTQTLWCVPESVLPMLAQVME